MRRKTNKGVSMVEILISIAIFAILMVPIVQGIISSLKQSTEAKTLQYRNEFAENVVEYVKQDSLINIMDGSYFTSIGSYTDSGAPITATATFYKQPSEATYDESLNELAALITKKPSISLTTQDSTLYSEQGKQKIFYPYESYSLSGKVKLGTEDEEYSYVMEISNKYYADKEAATKGSYVNPNNLALGIVEDIDHTKVALINGTIANYDQAVTNAFTAKKIELLKTLDPDWYEIYTQQQTGVDIFADDRGNRIITVKVSGSEDSGYKVTCNLKYYDNCESNSNLQSLLKDYSIEYNPFEYEYPVDPETKVATLPNIYLMYNVCIYNGQYVSDDYIAIDTSGVTDDTKVNLFVVETAETYSDNVVVANPELVEWVGDTVTKRPVLYNTSVLAGDEDRRNVKIHMAAAKGSTLSNINIYHNFDTLGSTNNNRKNEAILYKDDALDSIFNSNDYLPLESHSGGSKDVNASVADFNSLDAAKEENRGLYEIRLWIQQGDTVDTTVTPTITATKGGNES